MTSTVEPGTDVLDSLLGIAPGTDLYKVRHARDKVVAATQGSHELFFDPGLQDNLSLAERLLVAYYVCRLTPQALLADYYLEQLQAQAVDPALIAAIDHGAIASLDAVRLQAILGFTRTLIESPVEGDRAALQTLQDAGLSSSEIVVLAQLIAFLSYQVRLAAGLGALSTLGEAQ
ncbi:CMD domain protein [Pseudomonas cichorii]|nr:CMD domain protein [Pseudomonas cichorii]